MTMSTSTILSTYTHGFTYSTNNRFTETPNGHPDPTTSPHTAWVSHKYKSLLSNGTKSCAPEAAASRHCRRPLCLAQTLMPARTPQ